VSSLTILIFEYTVLMAFRHPEMPLIIRTRPNQDNGYYPMELCRILDNQRVKGDQQTPQQLAV
jgi:hypothetical protein